MKLIPSLAAMALAAGIFLCAPAPSSAQEPEVLMPEQSAAKARQILERAIEALGGPAYLNVHDITCTGTLSQFGHSGELNGFEKFIDYAVPPYKDRTENLPKRNIIQIFNGDKGWVLDRGGVSEAEASDVAQFQSDIKIDIDNILRHRMNEKDMILRYDGPDVVELKEADWVELVDSDDRTIRIAIARGTHLPIQKIVELRDPTTRMRSEIKEFYSNYHPLSGVETPFQIARERNGIKIFQVFFDKCDYNTNLADSLYTRDSLEERWDKIDKKHRKKEKSGDANKDNTSKSDSDSSN